jgi:hypothetical protein
MGISIQQEKDGSFVMQITGLLKKAEVETVQASAAKNFSPDTRIKLLIVAKNFEGWEKNTDWGDLSFFHEHGDKIIKIAVVAEQKWQTQFKMFVGAGYREAPVKIFSPNQLQDARIWLSE